MKILITGASRGIGLFLMQKFLKEKHEVFGTFNSTIPSVEFEKHLSQVDISVQAQVVNWINSIVSGEDKIIVLNCAGINYNSFAHKADIIKWRKVIDVNLIGTFNVISTVLPKMREKGFGRIVNLSSVVAQTRVPGTSAYAASKAGLWGLTRSISAENATKGITINNLNLGYYEIGMIKQVPEEYQKILKEKIPAGTFGDPIQIFNAINFIVENDYINGSSIDINGGLF